MARRVDPCSGSSSPRIVTAGGVFRSRSGVGLTFGQLEHTIGIIKAEASRIKLGRESLLVQFRREQTAPIIGEVHLTKVPLKR
jgi:hypothetical protein